MWLRSGLVDKQHIPSDWLEHVKCTACTQQLLSKQRFSKKNCVDNKCFLSAQTGKHSAKQYFSTVCYTRTYHLRSYASGLDKIEACIASVLVGVLVCVARVLSPLLGCTIYSQFLLLSQLSCEQNMKNSSNARKNPHKR